MADDGDGGRTLSDADIEELAARLAENPDLRERLLGTMLGALERSAWTGQPAPEGGGAQVAVVTGRGPAPPQSILDRSLVSTALADWLEKNRQGDRQTRFPVIVDLNLAYAGGRPGESLMALIAERLPGAVVNVPKSHLLPQYVFVTLDWQELDALIALDGETVATRDGVTDVSGKRRMHRIWPDFELRAQLHRTGATIKAEAARVAFAAGGQDIVWAVMDSGIDGAHGHFQQFGNLDVAPLQHQDFVSTGAASPLTDEFGHGTHVAGIIGGAWDCSAPDAPHFRAMVAYRDGQGEDTEYRDLNLPRISGIAPRTKMVSYKVLDAQGKGPVSNLLAAIAHIQGVNGNGKVLQIHGVNISVGYGFDPEWFACGQSPLCLEVDRLVRSGVVVVVAAGNTGYGMVASKLLGPFSTSLALTINDPGNADLAITVGAAHREAPHQYGVSYFSSKGPTGDGRLKPDLVAPGERVLSCAAGAARARMAGKGADGEYLEDSGTSMAAPHVSGAAAAFLSVQREFIGRPQEVKRVLMTTATDLGRHRDFQGAGMVDVMRAIQSV